MSISKTELLNTTTQALNEQTEYNDKRYLKKDETTQSELNITVGNSSPSGGLWFKTEE